MLKHQHPLSLIDLQLDDLDYEEEEEDDDVKQELTAKREFQCQCERCGKEINWFHRYYYKCDECLYSIHKFCEEVPATLKHPSHIAHTLILLQRKVNWRCNICRTNHEPEDLRYRCSECDFDIDLKCVMEWLKNNIIHHPSHMHPLVPITRDIMCECDACGKKHEGIFYQCTTCPSFLINKDCAFLPKKLKIQDATDDFFFHTHPLTLAYSFPKADQEAKHNPRCRVCGKFFDENENLWIYKCEDCRYYTHLDCATARGEPFMSIFSTPGFGKTIKNFEDADYPDLLHFPLPDQTDSLLKHMFLKQMTSPPRASNILQQHRSHPHPLILVDDTKSKAESSCLHNPMKKIEFVLPMKSAMTLFFMSGASAYPIKCSITQVTLNIPSFSYQMPLIMISFWFYHCYDCGQSIHSACSPIILDCKKAAPYNLRISKFLNIKFGGIHNIEDHSHPVSFHQGIESDGDCDRCSSSLWYEISFKCLECKYAIHFKCCEGFNGWGGTHSTSPPTMFI
ncbi:hypothetical protein OSB04_020759 [Centaurea solstitialis]|uniref:Phorbol-ester/DAG-type domain-containing protein n=1 Tax=Centaurea solstitialis TaxID=347529 RepID=A0AA38T492_9ASTR|nr:hypothetical protein OSB04_020759 [Centaurea solstitialis]